MKIEFAPAIPEIFICIAAMFLLILGVFAGDKKKPSFLYKASIVVLLLAGWQLLEFSNVVSIIVLNGLFILDNFAIFMKVIILLAAVFILVMSFGYTLNDKHEGQGRVLCFEFPILVLLAVVGMMVMVSANDLMSLYMGLELQSLTLYVLSAINRDSEKSSEAGMKYFMLGALASGILLYGCSLIYGFTGTTNLLELSSMEGPMNIGFLIGMILVIIGICFKVSAVPFHMWTPDVYEGAPKIITAFFATAPKVAAFAVFIRVTMYGFGNFVQEWQQIIIFISIISMLIGAFGALKQTNIKRLMAYSSIGHIGYLLIGLSTGTSEGVSAALFYLAIYVIMNIGVFACIILMKRRNLHVQNIGELSGVAKNSPMFAAAFAILMLSQAGIPPLAGFLGKFFIFWSALQAELYALAIIGALTSVIGAFYYLRIIKIMYFDSPNEHFDNEIEKGVALTIAGTSLFNLLFFIFPTPLLEASEIAVNALLL